MFEFLKNVPIHYPDTDAYTGYADLILKSSNWLYHASLEGRFFADVTVIRMPFYPMMIALHKYLFGDGWDIALVITQMIIALIALRFLIKLVRDLDFSPLQQWMVALIYIFGWPGYISLSILTDSFYTSCSLILICCLLQNVVRSSDRIHHVVLIAIIPVFMFLTREMTPYFIIALIPILVAIYLASSIKKIRKVLGILLIPLTITHAGISQWNVYRTGERFVSLGFATAIMYPLVMTQKDNPLILQGTSLANYTSHFKDYTFGEGLLILFQMGKDNNLDMVGLNSIIKKDFFHSWVLHPVTFTKYSLMELLRGVVFDVISPFQLLGPFFYGAEEQKVAHFHHLKHFEWGAWSWGGLIVFFLTLLCRTLSAFLFALFLYGLFKFPRNLAMVSIFGFCVLYMGLYSSVHLETRYIIPVLSLTSVGAIYYARKLWRCHA